MEQHGFIQDMLDVKVLILFVMAKLSYPVSLQKIYELCYQDDKLSYFDVSVAVPQMVQSGHLEQLPDETYRITDKGREHEEITNVLLSGGDSFLNSNETIARYLDALTPIGHLNYIRFGTRTPVTWPERIDEALCETLARYTARKTIFVVTQFNHPREITPESAAAVAALRRAAASSASEISPARTASS